MPYYDFRCDDCSKPSRLFFSFEAYDAASPSCTHCGSAALKRKIGRIAVAKSESAQADSLMDESMLGALENEDPRALGKFMRQMSAESGEPLGDEFGEVVERLEKGQSPEQIEKALPDIGDGLD